MPDPSTPPEVAAVLAELEDLCHVFKARALHADSMAKTSYGGYYDCGEAAAYREAERLGRDLIATIEREYRERAAAEELTWAWRRLDAARREASNQYVWIGAQDDRPEVRLLKLADNNFARARRLLGIGDSDT